MSTRRSDNFEEMKRVLRLLASSERLMQSGLTLDEAIVQLKLSRQEFESYFDRYAPALNDRESLNKSAVFRAVLPVFCDSSSRPMEHIGSATLLNIGDELFLLSAAHVFDHASEGDLYLPAAESIEAVTGNIAHGLLPASAIEKMIKLILRIAVSRRNGNSSYTVIALR